MRRLAPLLLVVLCAALPTGAAPLDPADPEQAVLLLQEFLRIDTTNPPGHELATAQWVAGKLEAEGVTARIDTFEPGRANLLAVLKGSGARRPVVLASHMDVVPADPARWSVPPFSGTRQNGFLYGRGAVDMKCEGILQLLAVLRLAREKVPLDRDVILLYTADEEVDYKGALRALSPKGFGDVLSKAEFMITEGGENVADASGAPLYFGLETGEKGPFWLTLKTTGQPGHGSRPIADSAVNRLVRALDRVQAWRPPLMVLPTVEIFFRNQADKAGDRAGWYRDIRAAIQDPEAARVLGEDRETAPLLRNTLSITILRAGYKTNVIPGTAEAEIDVRLLPGQDPQAFLADLRRVIDDAAVEIVTPKSFRPPNASPPEGELVTVVKQVLARHYPGVAVTPKMLTGATESVLFRGMTGASAYGFTPLVLSQAELDSQHGDDERINEAALRQAAPVFYEVIRDLSVHHQAKK